MTLLLAVLAGFISSLIWYLSERARTLGIGILCYMFWGASLMWFVDAIFEYLELRAEYFTPAPVDMLNDFFLGLSVIVLALVIWMATIALKDPEGRFRRS